MRITLKNLSKSFFNLRGEITALKNINLEIKDKEFFVLLGPSGCGKSTLLNLIAGLEKPTSGEILFAEKVVASPAQKKYLTAKERNVAMVFQSYALYPHLSVFENIAFPLRISKQKNDLIKETVNKAAETLKISNLLDVKPGGLSGGQRQRVAIARAIVREPSVFLLDEPLSNLDAKLRSSTRSELKILQKNLGITSVYVTHDQIEAMTMGDRIAVLKDGVLEQVGTPEELYDHPVSPFIATFIGSPAMNLIKTKIEDNSIIIDDKKIELPKELLKKVSTNEFTFGLRPEHIKINPTSTQHNLKTKIVNIEPMGREVLLRTKLKDINNDEIAFTLLTNKKTFKLDEVVDLGFEMGKGHLF